MSNPEAPKLAVGSTIWRFDRECRKYGRDRSTPIYREHWQPYAIVGETSRSWLVGHLHNPSKAPNSGAHPGWAFTAQEVDDDCWANENRYQICRIVERCSPAKLRQIAEIVGWKEACDAE